MKATLRTATLTSIRCRLMQSIWMAVLDCACVLCRRRTALLWRRGFWIWNLNEVVEIRLKRVFCVLQGWRIL